jgi:hypothetical protein
LQFGKFRGKLSAHGRRDRGVLEQAAKVFMCPDETLYRRCGLRGSSP